MKNHQIWIRMFCCWLILVNLLITLSGCGKNLQARMMEQLDLGNRYLVELNYQEASIAFEKAIQLEDRNVDAWLGLAQANVGLANNAEGAQSESYYTKAEDAYLKVIELDPERTESYLELAQVYEATGQTEQAIALLEGALDKVSQREQMEKLLEELRQRHSGTVRMTVLSQTTPGMPVADVEVVLENGQNRFTGTTDENGTFQQQVPVGTYSVIIRDGDEEVYQHDFRVMPDENLDLGEISVDVIVEEEVPQNNGETLYAPILDTFYQWISNGAWNENDMYYGLRNSFGEDWGEADEASYLWAYYYTDGLSGAGYCFQDLNQDGVPELLISPVDSAQSGAIYDLFTYSGGQVVHLCASGERDWFTLCENGTISEEGSGGAGLHEWSYYTLPAGRAELKSYEEVWYYADRDRENPWFYTSEPRYVMTEWGETLDESCLIPITETEANEIIDSHSNVSFDVSTFEEYSQEHRP